MCGLIGLTFEDTQERTKWKVRDVFLRGGDDDCAKDDEEYAVWVVEYYPAERPPDPGPSGAGVEWSPVGYLYPHEIARASCRYR